jgi:hypothetical protein
MNSEQIEEEKIGGIIEEDSDASEEARAEDEEREDEVEDLEQTPVITPAMPL